MKYVMLKTRAIELPVIFPSVFQHHEFGDALGAAVVSAGFCRVSTLPDGSVHVDAYGASMSLAIGCREQDAAIIREHLQRREL